MKFEEIKSKAESYRADMTKFLRELVKIPGEVLKKKVMH